MWVPLRQTRYLRLNKLTILIKRGWYYKAYKILLSHCVCDCVYMNNITLWQLTMMVSVELGRMYTNLVISLQLCSFTFWATNFALLVGTQRTNAEIFFAKRSVRPLERLSVNPIYFAELHVGCVFLVENFLFSRRIWYFVNRNLDGTSVVVSELRKTLLKTPFCHVERQKCGCGFKIWIEGKV